MEFGTLCTMVCQNAMVRSPTRNPAPHVANKLPGVENAGVRTNLGSISDDGSRKSCVLQVSTPIKRSLSFIVDEFAIYVQAAGQ